MIKLPGIVVLYNPTMDDLININSYIDYLDKLYVVDNSERRLEKELPKKVEYIFNGENLGMAKALNIGVEKAINDGYNWLLTLDQDTTLNKKIFEEVSKVIEEKDTSDIAIITPWHKTKLDKEKENNTIDYPLDVMTSGNFVNLDIVKKIGNFKEELFIDGIDIEFCLRIKKYGYKIMRLNYVEIEHNLGNIEYHKLFGRTWMCTNHNYLRNYYMARNYRYIKKEYRSIAPEFCDTLVKYKGIMFKIIMFEKDKYRKIRNIFRGIRDYKKGITGKYRFKD